MSRGVLPRTKRVSQQRNKLAHWGVSEYSAAMPGRRLALVPLAMTIENFRARMVGLPEPHRKDEGTNFPQAFSTSFSSVS
jgi:hypothetical protein